MDPSRENAETALDCMIDRLHARGRLRVWSLVISAFGDAVVPRGGRVALTILQDIMGRLRIEPGALRTAMSRLAADGWVIREREGRNAFYRLAEGGRHAFDLATRRIYAGSQPDWDGSWTVAITSPDKGLDLPDAATLGFVRLNGCVYLRPETKGALPLPAELADTLVIHGESADHPEAFGALWPSLELGAAYRQFISAATPLAAALGRGGGLKGVDAVAARILLIHDWRRIVLRDPALPRELLPDDWPGEEAREIVRVIYEALHAASEAWLDAADLPCPASVRRFAEAVH